MKKVLLLMMAILMSIVSFAEEVNLAEVDPTTWPGPHKAPPLLPKPSHCPSWVPDEADGDDSNINYTSIRDKKVV